MMKNVYCLHVSAHYSCPILMKLEVFKKKKKKTKLYTRDKTELPGLHNSTEFEYR